jgi:double zinc ribbon protein
VLAEVAAAVLLGVLALWLVLWPMFSQGSSMPRPEEPPDPEETARGVALTALKEIEFDRETGKLSDADYAFLKEKYTAAALDALRADTPDDIEAMVAARVRVLRTGPAPGDASAAVCPTCGPRPEPDAVFCSTCGQRLPVAGRCEHCGAALAPEGRFCEGCGSRVAA